MFSEDEEKRWGAGLAREEEDRSVEKRWWGKIGARREKWEKKGGKRRSETRREIRLRRFSAGALRLSPPPLDTASNQPGCYSSAMQIAHAPTQTHTHTLTFILEWKRKSSGCSNCLLPALAVSIISGRELKVWQPNWRFTPVPHLAFDAHFFAVCQNLNTHTNTWTMIHTHTQAGILHSIIWNACLAFS